MYKKYICTETKKSDNFINEKKSKYVKKLSKKFKQLLFFSIIINQRLYIKYKYLHAKTKQQICTQRSVKLL